MKPREIRDWAVATNVGGLDPGAEMPKLVEYRARLEASEAPEAQMALAAVVARIAQSILLQGRPQEAFVHALKAEAIAAAGEDPTVWALSQQALALILHRVGQLEEAHHRLERVVHTPGVAPEIGFHARVNSASALRAQGRLEEATEAFDELMAFRGTIDPIRWVVMLVNAASCWNQVERIDDAQRALDEARRLLPLGTRKDLRSWIDAIGAWVAVQGGRPEAGRLLALDVLLDDSIFALPLLSSGARALAEASLLLGENEQSEARIYLEQVLARAMSEHARHEAYDLHSTLAIVAEAQDDLVAAVRHLRATREVQAKLHQDRERLRLASESMRLELARMQVEAESLRNHQRALARANNALAAADASRQKLLRTLAHDLRNPLTSLTILVEHLDASEPAELERRKAQIHQTLERMTRLLEVAVTPEATEPSNPVDIAQLVRESTEAFEGLAERKQQRIVVDTPAPAPSRTNAESVRRIADNLVSNALKFSPPGTTVRVEVAQHEQSIELTVQDEGPGFPSLRPEEGLLYGAQMAARSTAEEPSWGIGLHTVYRLASDLGGVVALGNDEAGGATVKVRIPSD